MNYKILLAIAFSITIGGCRNEGAGQDEHGHEHEEHKFQYTAYTDDFEVFAEADPFIAGDSSNVLSHFSHLPSFKAVEEGTITIILSAGGSETRQTLDKPTRKGIYSFDILPSKAGIGTLRYEIVNSKGTFIIQVPDITVFPTDQDADEAAEKITVPHTNTSGFTKEQSWKVDFATGMPSHESIGQIIKTTARISPAQGSEAVVTARTAGIVILNQELPLGKEVSAGQKLFTISAGEMADNNSAVRLTQIQSEYTKAKADYERAVELSKDRIVSEKELSTYRNQYENAKAAYDNVSKNFSGSVQIVTSPLAGFINDLYVSNGSFVEAGAPVLKVSQNKSLILNAEVPVRYASQLPAVVSANVRDMNGNVRTLEELNGSILSYGKSAGDNNYLLPITLKIDNKGQFIPGSFLELYLKTRTANPALVVPSSSLIEEQGNFFIWVQITPELFEKREVRIGTTDGLNTEIISGLTEKERIITKGAMLVRLAQSTGTLDAHSGHVH